MNLKVMEDLAPMLLRLSVILSIILIALNLEAAYTLHRDLHSKGEVSQEVIDQFQAHGVSEAAIQHGEIREMDFSGGTVIHIRSFVVVPMMLAPFVLVGLTRLFYPPSITTRLGKIALGSAIISFLINFGIIVAIACGVVS